MDSPASERITIEEMVEAVTTTLANARAEGEPYKRTAEEQLGPIEAILRRITLERIDAEAALTREETELEQLDEQVETVIQTSADEIWDRLGCPDYDPIYNILFPSVTDGTSTGQAKANRLSVVADLLTSGMHPKIDRAHAALVAQKIRALAEEYHERLYVLSKHQVRKTSLDGFEASVARIGLLELGTLRRTLRNMGVDDTNIKSVVPPPVSSRRAGA
jgi:hypothetical protein